MFPPFPSLIQTFCPKSNQIANHELKSQVDEIAPPTIYDTVLYRLPKWIYNESLGKLLNKRTQDAEMADLVEEEQEGDEADASLKAARASNANSETRKRKSKAKPR